jgi:hypothetical protein
VLRLIHRDSAEQIGSPYAQSSVPKIAATIACRIAVWPSWVPQNARLLRRRVVRIGHDCQPIPKATMKPPARAIHSHLSGQVALTPMARTQMSQKATFTSYAQSRDVFRHRAAAAFFACARRCTFVSPSHFARDALLADALRCSGVRLRLRALPP